MSYCDHLPPILRPLTHLNDFSSETPEPFFLKFHTRPFVNGELKICSNGHGPLIKSAAIPIYGKTLKTRPLQNQENSKAESLYRVSGTQVLQSLFSYDDRRQGQIRVPMY